MSDTPDPESAENLPDSSVREDPDPWRAIFQESESGLRAFLRGRLRQASDVDDCLQIVYVKLIENGRNVSANARRAWLFRVAANESAQLWRRKASTEKMLERYGAEDAGSVDPTKQVILTETSAKIRKAIGRLPESWQRVVRLRIYENLTFQQISDQLDIPLGTALTQMRRALERLKTELEVEET
ncbi:MAG: RNA polymerase sigma factor [Rubripirellula sp.]